MTVRHHPITGEPILFAPGRAGRPNAFGATDELPCPFCPGQEHQTPPEIERLGDSDGWRVRVVPNKYPATSNHEVVIESSRHEAQFEETDPLLIDLYSRRVAALASRPDVAYVSLFKNHGVMAGASLPHLHSQLIGIPFIPPRIQREMAAFRSAPCFLCRSLGPTVIHRGREMTLLAPTGSTFNHQVWIIPNRHVADFTELTIGERQELMECLHRLASWFKTLADAYNWAFLSYPDSAGHFHVDAFPRTTPIAGFELATGTCIGVVDPSEAAAELRSILQPGSGR